MLLVALVVLGIGIEGCERDDFLEESNLLVKQDEISTRKASLSLDEMRILAKERAKQAWEEYLNSSVKSQKHREFKSGNGGPASPCNCSYKVLDVSLTYPGEYTDVDLNFGTPLAECEPGNPWECDYFEALYNSYYPDCVTLINPACVDVWPSLPPATTPYPFDCEVDRNSSFLVSFSAVALAPDNCVVWDYFDSGYITFQIYCAESVIECGPGYVYSSDPITLSIAGSNFEDNAVISLAGECGCEPFTLTPGGSGNGQ